MNKRNEWAVSHKLTRITSTLEFGPPCEEGVVVGTIHGWSSTKRGALWSEHNLWQADDDDVLMAPADWLHHIHLVGMQDKPNSKPRLIYGLTGGLGFQDPMF